jgi:uncharacterized protein (DUF2062 family)
MHYRLRTEGDTPVRQAAAVGLGTFIGCQPIYGLHLALCVIAARWLGLNRLTMYLSTYISNPLTLPFLLLAGWQVGYLVLHGHAPGRGAVSLEVGSLLGMTRDLLVGSLIVGLALGLVVGLVAHRIGRRKQKRPFVRRLTSPTKRPSATCPPGSSPGSTSAGSSSTTRSISTCSRRGACRRAARSSTSDAAAGSSSHCS